MENYNLCIIQTNNYKVRQSCITVQASANVRLTSAAGKTSQTVRPNVCKISAVGKISDCQSEGPGFKLTIEG